MFLSRKKIIESGGMIMGEVSNLFNADKPHTYYCEKYKMLYTILNEY